MNYMDQYKFWLEDSYFDEGTKEELRKIADNQAEIEDRFTRIWRLVPAVCAV